VGSFGGINGMIVFLDDSGNLAVSFLGTDPSSNIVNVHSEKKEVNYEEMDEELRSLQSIIRETTNGIKEEPSDHLIISVGEFETVNTNYLFIIP
jgi:hypothetical protein